jgi:DNA (cytosine-5)-methyltransferase 1
MKADTKLSVLTKLKVLNLYAGIGGNRKLWSGCDVTAVENVPEIADTYKQLYPDDTVIVADAHKYLLDHFKEFDFIWSSPPCQSHSSFRHNINVRFRGTPPKYPDMTLYEEIIFMRHNATCPYVIENVKPYYEPLIKAQQIQRHLFWTNFDIPPKDFPKDIIRKAQIPDLQKKFGFDLSGYKISNKRQVLRNCVEPELGLYVYDSALKTTKQEVLL